MKLISDCNSGKRNLRVLWELIWSVLFLEKVKGHWSSESLQVCRLWLFVNLSLEAHAAQMKQKLLQVFSGTDKTRLAPSSEKERSSVLSEQRCDRNWGILPEKQGDNCTNMASVLQRVQHWVQREKHCFPAFESITLYSSKL